MKDQSIGNVKIIFVIKDIRSYTISQANRKLVKTKMEHEGWRGLFLGWNNRNVFLNLE